MKANKQGGLTVIPLGFRAAREFVRAHHRHSRPPVGHKFSIGLMENEKLCGVVIVGRPVARMCDDGYTAEVLRLCVSGSQKNACSKLYAHAARAARAMGYRRIITYTLSTEPGTSLRASGWSPGGLVRGRSWSTRSRPREDPDLFSDKVRWERRFNDKRGE